MGKYAPLVDKIVVENLTDRHVALVEFESWEIAQAMYEEFQGSQLYEEGGWIIVSYFDVRNAFFFFSFCVEKLFIDLGLFYFECCFCLHCR